MKIVEIKVILGGTIAIGSILILVINPLVIFPLTHLNPTSELSTDALGVVSPNLGWVSTMFGVLIGILIFVTGLIIKIIYDSRDIIRDDIRDSRDIIRDDMEKSQKKYRYR